MNLTQMKEKYNETLKRVVKADKVFKSSSVEQCLKLQTLYNSVVIELSLLRIEIEQATGQKMTDSQILNGF